MKKAWLLIYLLVLTGDLLAIQLKIEWLQYFLKPMVVAVLLAYFISSLKNHRSDLKKWILFALFFSSFGDVLLMFDQKAEIYFLLGLSAFLIAHIFYIIFFHHVRVRENIKSNPWLLGIVVIYYASLIILLAPYLGDKNIPVRVYGVVISFMFMLAMHMLFIKQKKAGRWMMLGALLFVISDSILAINKFYMAFEGAGILVMLSYGLAQFFIVEGSARYVRYNDSGIQ